jgi:hypothetical protein
MDVDFDDAGIGRHFQHGNPGIPRRRVAFHEDGHFEMRGRIFDGGRQIEIVLRDTQPAA